MRIKRLFLFIWAYIPIFALTDDLSFLAANKGASDADVANKLNEFQNQKIIWMPDNTLQKNQIKIILEK